MKKSITAMALGLGLFAATPFAQAALAEHFGKNLSLLEVADSPCIFFQLSGVTQANPAVANGVWFAIDKNQGNAKEMYALLLSTRVSGMSITRVLTNGEIVCGAAKVLTIDL